jgi:hypothetical protein
MMHGTELRALAFARFAIANFNHRDVHMIDYYDPPIFPLSKLPAPAQNDAAMRAYIKATMPSPLHSGTYNPLPVSFQTIVATMWRDAGWGGLSPLTCESICADLIEVHGSQ